MMFYFLIHFSVACLLRDDLCFHNFLTAIVGLFDFSQVQAKLRDQMVCVTIISTYKVFVIFQTVISIVGIVSKETGAASAGN